jgi:ribosomal protein L37E
MSYEKRIRDNSITYINKDGHKIGSAFRTEAGNVGLTRCPECNRENYALNIIKGICSWCGFDANEDLKDD